MATEIQGAIDVLLAQIEAKNHEINQIKSTINGLCRATGREPMFDDDQMREGVTGRVSLKPDSFYGVGPTAAVRKYLEMRGKNNGAASLDEIFDALKRGGFDFAGQGWTDTTRWKNQISIAIGKNVTIFHRLPNESIGLTVWYPDAGGKRKAAKDDDKSKSTTTATENGGDITSDATTGENNEATGDSSDAEQTMTATAGQGE